MIQSRRSFLRGIAAALAAPVIVKASSIMPVKAVQARAGSIHVATHPFWNNRQVDGGLTIDKLRKFRSLMIELGERIDAGNEVILTSFNESILTTNHGSPAFDAGQP